MFAELEIGYRKNLDENASLHAGIERLELDLLKVSMGVSGEVEVEVKIESQLLLFPEDEDVVY